MKNLVLVFLFLGSLVQARVSNVHCGLPGTTADNGIKQDKSYLNLVGATGKTLIALPAISQAQLIRAAFLDEDLAVNQGNLRKAMAVLWDASEAADVYLVNFTYRGKRFTYVQFFPGGNEGGVIFPYGSAVPVAQVGDQDIDCIRPKQY